MPDQHARRYDEPGPFRAEQLRSGDPYELSNGHLDRWVRRAAVVHKVGELFAQR